jgi:hypothetical protein
MAKDRNGCVMQYEQRCAIERDSEYERNRVEHQQIAEMALSQAWTPNAGQSGTNCYASKRPNDLANGKASSQEPTHFLYLLARYYH